jgi:hypothetical protein
MEFSASRLWQLGEGNRRHEHQRNLKSSVTNLDIRSHGFDIPSLWLAARRMQQSDQPSEKLSATTPALTIHSQHGSLSLGARGAACQIPPASPDPTVLAPNSQKKDRTGHVLDSECGAVLWSLFCRCRCLGLSLQTSPGPDRGCGPFEDACSCRVVSGSSAKLCNVEQRA